MDVDIPFVPWTVVHTEEDDDHDDCPNVVATRIRVLRRRIHYDLRNSARNVVRLI